ncbi:unnamed protein product [Amoebophrya sp. A120]|nr:unnamed protein product [Amoebophrya sp. A120]|eukprot:GSA120T00013105001.1
MLQAAATMSPPPGVNLRMETTDEQKQGEDMSTMSITTTASEQDTSGILPQMSNQTKNTNSASTSNTTTAPPPLAAHLVVPKVDTDLCYYAWDVVSYRLNKLVDNEPVFPPSYDAQSRSPLFVTWLTWEPSRGQEELRGCIGCLEPLDLHPGLRDYTVKAAFEDSRFPPIQAGELPMLICQVSVLHSFEPAAHGAYDWEVGKHGIIISFEDPEHFPNRQFSATYLPEVALEHDMTRETAIVELIKKAGYRRAVDQVLLDRISLTRYQSKRVKVDFADYKWYCEQRRKNRMFSSSDENNTEDHFVDDGHNKVEKSYNFYDRALGGAGAPPGSSGSSCDTRTPSSSSSANSASGTSGSSCSDAANNVGFSTTAGTTASATSSSTYDNFHFPGGTTSDDFYTRSTAHNSACSKKGNKRGVVYHRKRPQYRSGGGGADNHHHHHRGSSTSSWHAGCTSGNYNDRSYSRNNTDQWSATKSEWSGGRNDSWSSSEQSWSRSSSWYNDDRTSSFHGGQGAGKNAWNGNSSYR